MRAVSKRPVSPGRVAAFIGAFAIALGVLAVMPRIEAGLHRSVCAAGSFIDTTPPVSKMVMGLTVTFFIVVMLMAVGLWPSDAGVAVPLTPVAARVVRRGCAIMLVLAVYAMSLSVWLFAPGSLCMSSEGLRYRAARFLPVHSYGWGDLSAMTMSCSVSKHGESISVTLEMAGGRAIRLSGRDYVAHIDALESVLAGRSFGYDASAVAAGPCSNKTKAWLAARP